jgi:chromosome segregation ATPase
LSESERLAAELRGKEQELEELFGLHGRLNQDHEELKHQLEKVPRLEELVDRLVNDIETVTQKLAQKQDESDILRNKVLTLEQLVSRYQPYEAQVDRLKKVIEADNKEIVDLTNKYFELSDQREREAV